MSWFMHSNTILAIQQGKCLIDLQENPVYCLQEIAIFVLKSLLFQHGVSWPSLTEVYTVGTH